MELGQSVFRWGVVSLPYRLFGVDSFHLRGGSSFGPFLLFEAVAVLYTPCMLYGVLAFSNAYLVYLSKKKKKKKHWWITMVTWDRYTSVYPVGK